MPDVKEERINKRNGKTEKERREKIAGKFLLFYFSRLRLFISSVAPFLLFIFFRFRQA